MTTQQVASRLLSSPQLYKLHTRILGGRTTKKRIFTRHFPKSLPLRVLDIGCGPGVDRDLFGDAFWTGIDSEPRYVQHAKQHLRDGDRVILGDAANFLELDLGNFELVLLAGVLHHLDDEQVSNLLRDCVEVIGVGGLIMTIDPVRTEIAKRTEIFLLNSDRGKFIRTAEGYNSLTPKSLCTTTEVLYPRLCWVPQTTRVAILGRC